MSSHHANKKILGMLGIEKLTWAKDQLEKLATIGDGHYFNATDQQSLNYAFNKIAKNTGIGTIKNITDNTYDLIIAYANKNYRSHKLTRFGHLPIKNGDNVSLIIGAIVFDGTPSQYS